MRIIKCTSCNGDLPEAYGYHQCSYCLSYYTDPEELAYTRPDDVPFDPELEDIRGEQCAAEAKERELRLREAEMFKELERFSRQLDIEHAWETVWQKDGF